jgi:outer membrane protein insertion porin family
VEYTVEEQPSGSITASVGYADFSGLNLGVNVQQSNWLGTGKVVGFGVTRNLYQTNYSFSYNDPYFTPDGVSRGFTAFFRSIDTDVLTTIPYSTDTFGGQMNFGYPISEISRIGFAFGLENQVITTGSNARVAQEIRQTPYLKNDNLVYVTRTDYENALGRTDEYQLDLAAITDDMLADDGEPGFIDLYGNEFNNATFDLSWSRFTLNRGVLATRGSSQTLRLEATVPGSDMEYYKLHYEAQAFRPLGKGFTLRFKTALGYGNGYGELDELPFFTNFYAGGFGSVRGFEQSSLGPQGSNAREYLTTSAGWQDLNQNGVQDIGESLGTAYVLCDDTTPGFNISSCTQGKLVDAELGLSNRRNGAFGGNVLVEFGTELILPMPFVKDSRSMQLVAFVDAGNVFSTYCRETQQNCHNVDLSELSSSAGIGFTWLSGFGPMTFAYAKPLHKSEFDEREAFQFTFGAGF